MFLEVKYSYSDELDKADGGGEAELLERLWWSNVVDLPFSIDRALVVELSFGGTFFNGTIKVVPLLVANRWWDTSKHVVLSATKFWCSAGATAFDGTFPRTRAWDDEAVMGRALATPDVDGGGEAELLERAWRRNVVDLPFSILNALAVEFSGGWAFFNGTMLVVPFLVVRDWSSTG